MQGGEGRSSGPPLDAPGRGGAVPLRRRGGRTNGSARRLPVVVARGSGAHRALRAGRWAAVAVGAVAVPLVVSSFTLTRWTLAVAYGVALLGLTVLTGASGQISLGHGAFFAVGGYATAVLVVLHGWPYLATLPVAAVLAGAVGLALGVPATRLRGFALALVTLAAAVVFPRLVSRFESVTRGVQGIIVPGATFEPPPWVPLTDGELQWAVAVAVAVPAFVLAGRVLRSPFGRALVALRDDELPAQSLGVHLAGHRVAAFALSGAFAAVGGSLAMFTARLAAPTSFGYELSLQLVAAAVVGGVRHPAGALLGGAVLQFLPAVAFRVQEAGLGFAGAAYGALIVVLAVAAPGGVAGLVAGLVARVVRVTEPLAAPPGAGGPGGPPPER